MGWVAVKKNPGVVGDEGRVMVGRMGRVGEESYVRSTVTLRASLYVYSVCVGGGEDQCNSQETHSHVIWKPPSTDIVPLLLTRFFLRQQYSNSAHQGLP